MWLKVSFIIVLMVCFFASALDSLAAASFDVEEFELQRVQRRIPHPATLDEFVLQVNTLKQLGAESSEIAEYMSNVVDKRLKADNRAWDESVGVAALRTWGVSSIGPIKRLLDEYKLRWAPLDKLRAPFHRLTEPHPVDDGQLYAATAQTAWDIGLGNCSESASVAYFVLKRAGIQARIFASCAGGGHEFVVVGLSANANPNDPDSWGDEARVVDGWTGHTLTPSQAFVNGHFFSGRTRNADGGPMIIDATNSYDNPGAHAKWEALGSKGIVLVTVIRYSDKQVAPGAAVRLKAQEEQIKVSNYQGIAYFECYPGASVKFEVEPPDMSGLAKESASVSVQTKWIVPLTIALRNTDKNWQPGLWEETCEQSRNKRTITLSRQDGTVNALAGNKTYTGADRDGILRLSFQYSDQGQLIISEGPQIPIEVRQQIVERKPVNLYEMKVISPTLMEGTKSDSWFFNWDPSTGKLHTLELDPPEKAVWKKLP